MYKCWLPLPKVELGLNFCRLSTPKKERPDKWPESNMSKELGEDIGWIDLLTDVKEPDHIRCNGFMNTMISKGIIITLWLSPNM
jgi:hypothetical protein